MKSRYVFLLGLLIVSFVMVSGKPSEITNTEEDLKKAEELIEKVKDYKIFTTKAETRIAEINFWLGENIGWMRYIFHMKPEISFLFIFNVFIILWFFTLFVMDAEGFWFFIESKGNSMIFGGAIFFALLVSRFYYGLATIAYAWLLYIWNIVIGSIIWTAIFVIFTAILFKTSFNFRKILTASIASYSANKKALKQSNDVKTNVEVIDELTRQIGKKD